VELKKEEGKLGERKMGNNEKNMEVKNEEAGLVRAC
jgi:hypothetical protein